MHRVRVAVVGGGVAGLTAAWTLARAAPGTEVVVLESTDRVGVKLRRETLAGEPVDVGAESPAPPTPRCPSCSEQRQRQHQHLLHSCQSIRTPSILSSASNRL